MHADREPDLTREVIELAIEVHRHPGPGLLESAYEECLCSELQRAAISFARRKTVPVRHKDAELNCRYGVDIVVDDNMAVEVKAVDLVSPMHEAQLLTWTIFSLTVQAENGLSLCLIA